MSETGASRFGEAGGRRERPAGFAPADSEARQFACDPANNVVLEASAGTGKTSVLVERYFRLLEAGVDPANVLAITFTRKAAAEMRDRIVRRLRRAAEDGELDRGRWLDLRDRLGEIAISTIDAFCLSLLREFPLEADVEPGFDLADETEVARLTEAALDHTLRVCGHLAREDESVALVTARLGTARLRAGLQDLLRRRDVARRALERFLARGPADLTAARMCRSGVERLERALAGVPGGPGAFLADGPGHHPRYALLAADLRQLRRFTSAEPGAVRALLDRVADYFLTQDGRPRQRPSEYRAAHAPSGAAWRRHTAALKVVAPAVREALQAFERDTNVLLARGIRRIFAVAHDRYRRALDEHAVLDFAEVLERAFALLGRMDEFAQSRFRLESRYHHVLVDEFQDTSRMQWELVARLIRSWGDGFGLVADAPLLPTIFIVGDRKQSIYRFRDAEVAVLEEAGVHVSGLRPGRPARRSITHSFRAVPALLAFVNDLFDEIARDPAGSGRGAFRYGPEDRFPVDAAAVAGPETIGLVTAGDPDACAHAVADEIARLLAAGTARDRTTGVARQVRPGDVAILFRSRESHRELEAALESRAIPAYVHKGLGFFDADEIKDVCALLRYLADPESDLKAAAFLRSRFVRLSDAALAALAPDLAGALRGPEACGAALDEEDRAVLARLRSALPGWLDLVDRVPPAEVVDRILADSAYACELRGPRRCQAIENLKKIRSLIRRIQNRGYATVARLAEHVDRLSTGEEANAVIEALDAVNLMTVHAAKGLEFPIVFVANLARGTGGRGAPIRVVPDPGGETASVSVDRFQSEADEAERGQEQEETKRLLYVATTRSRDRLYLASALENGVFVPRPGSLGRVLPPSWRGLFGEAAGAATGSTIAWQSAAGRTHLLRVCHGGAAAEPSPAAPPGSGEETAADFGPLSVETGVRMVEAAEWASGSVESARAALSRSLRSDPELARLLAAGEALFDVPFSLRREASAAGGPGALVRGVIDCLVLQDDRRAIVLELRTGAPLPEHRLQLDLCVEAARSFFPDHEVDGRLVYAG